MAIRSHDVEAALRKRFPAEAYALIFQVANGTGGNKTRTADALAFGLWPSRGLDVQGIEIKVSRSDWLREIADPSKASTFSKHCHRWWIATLPGIVESGELPATWGLLELKRGVMRQAVEAPRNPTPEPIPHKMWCAVMRAVQNAELQAVNAARRTIEKDAKREAEERVADDLNRFRSAVERFKESTGVDVLRSWNAEEIGRALKMVEDHRHQDMVLRSLARVPEYLREVAAKVEEAVP